jgi:asparagine synthase (glutamine-hydrolysing)
MCGIAGRFHAARLTPDATWAARASALLAHRGPDGEGYWTDERCELVHRRLALIDLSPTGRQPMTNEDGSLLIVFNGEIYNYRELTADLKRRGHRFRSTSDTEVLLHLFEDHGERMLARVRGIFAFAIYDRRRGRLFLARDRFGVKPLFYTLHDGAWAFASELKALVALPGFRPELDRQACYDFLGLGYIPEPATGFTNIRALPRASCFLITHEGHHLREYDRLASHPDRERTLVAAVASAADTLVAATEAQSVADVPVAALLSGGIDSSLVVAAHSRATGQPATTFNARFPDRAHDETTLAVAVSQQYATRHHTIDLGDWAMSAQSILDLMRHFDQPFADTSFLPTYWIARAVRDRGIICTLSGDGGDEAFGGYSRFWRLNRLVQLMRVPDWAAVATEAATGRLAPWTRDWGRQVSKAVQLARTGRGDSARLLAGLSNYLSEEQKQALVLAPARDGLLDSYRHFNGYEPPGGSDLEELSRRVTENLFAVSLPSDMLRKVDMMSMRASIEVRVPLLDEDVVATGLALPHRLKTDGRRGKLVLRALAEQWLPRRVTTHPKHGFTVPLDVMVPDEFHTVLEELLLAPDARTQGWLDRTAIARWLRQFRAARHGPRGGTISRGGLYQRVFMVLSLELWLREFNLTW